MDTGKNCGVLRERTKRNHCGIKRKDPQSSFLRSLREEPMADFGKVYLLGTPRRAKIFNVAKCRKFAMHSYYLRQLWQHSLTQHVYAGGRASYWTDRKEGEPVGAWIQKCRIGIIHRFQAVPTNGPLCLRTKVLNILVSRNGLE